MAKMSRKEKEKWKNLSSKPLTMDFILENKEYLDFKLVCKHSILDQKFIEENLIDYVDWTALTLYQNIDKEFIWNNAQKVNWVSVSYSKDLTVDHLEKYKSMLDWKTVIIRHKYEEETLIKFKKYIDWQQVCIYQKLSVDFIKEHHLLLFPFKYEIAKYQKLSEEYLEENKDNLDWDIISEYQTLSEDFIDKMSDYVNWTWITEKQKMTKKFIMSHLVKLNLYRLMTSKRYIPSDLKKSDLYYICNYYNTNKKYNSAS